MRGSKFPEAGGIGQAGGGDATDLIEAQTGSLISHARHLRHVVKIAFHIERVVRHRAEIARDPTRRAVAHPFAIAHAGIVHLHICDVAGSCTSQMDRRGA